MNINTQKSERDCGLYCLQFFYHYFYNKERSLNHFKQYVHYNNQGINLTELTISAKHNNLIINSFEVDFLEFRTLKIIDPIIINIKLNDLYHFVIILKKTKNHFWILDPINGKSKISARDLELQYTKLVIFVKKSKSQFKKQPVIFKEKNSLLWTLIFHNPKQLIALSILLLTVAIGNIVFSYYLKFIVDYVLPSQASSLLNFLFLFFIWLATYKTTAIFINNLIKSRFSIKSKLKMKKTFFKYLNYSNYHNFNTLTQMDLLRRVQLIDLLCDYYLNVLQMVVQDLFLIIIALFFLLFLSTNLIYILFLTTLLIFVISFLFYKMRFRWIERSLNANFKLNTTYFQNFNTHRAQKLTHFRNYFSNLQNKLELNNSYIMIKLNNLEFSKNFVVQIIIDLSYILIIFLGAKKIISNDFSLGDLLLFITMFTMFITSFDKINNLLLNWNEMKKNRELVLEVFTWQHEDLNDSGILIDKIKTITLKNVFFEYEHGKPIIKIKNLEFNTNTHVFGPNGSGKSTLFKILSTYLKPKGSILINNKNIKNINLQNYRNSVFLVNKFIPDIHFSKYVSQNKEELVEFMHNIKKFNLEKILNQIGLDFNYFLKDNGREFSAGEKQIILLMPLFAKQYSLILLDEVFENISINTQYQLASKIIEYQKSAMILYISHNSNNIFQFAKGVEIV